MNKEERLRLLNAMAGWLYRETVESDSEHQWLEDELPDPTLNDNIQKEWPW